MTAVAWMWTLSKRRLSVDDPLFEDGDIVCYTPTKVMPLEADDLPADKHRHSETSCQYPCEMSGCGKSFSTLTGFEAHYNSVHSRVCHVCHRCFPSCHLLDIHLLEWHDSMFEIMAAKQPMYQCLVEACTSKFLSKKERKNHLMKTHKYPSNYRFDRTSKPSKITSKAKIAMETDQVLPCNSEEFAARLKEENSDKTSNSDTAKSQNQGKKFSYKVPKNICFGQGVSRGFQRSRGRGRHRKHWHSKQEMDMDTHVDIEKVDMNELADAL